jgi:hypothetical protein
LVKTRTVMLLFSWLKASNPWPFTCQALLEAQA